MWFDAVVRSYSERIVLVRINLVMETIVPPRQQGSSAYINDITFDIVNLMIENIE
jgi:hypothetical protein